jgi:hypothetical protein
LDNELAWCPFGGRIIDDFGCGRFVVPMLILQPLLVQPRRWITIAQLNSTTPRTKTRCLLECDLVPHCYWGAVAFGYAAILDQFQRQMMTRAISLGDSRRLNPGFDTFETCYRSSTIPDRDMKQLQYCLIQLVGRVGLALQAR